MDGAAIGAGLSELFKIVVVAAIILSLGVIGIFWVGIKKFEWFAPDEIRTTEPLKPSKLELEVTNGTEIDTIYVYKLDNL